MEAAGKHSVLLIDSSHADLQSAALTELCTQVVCVFKLSCSGREAQLKMHVKKLYT